MFPSPLRLSSECHLTALSQQRDSALSVPGLSLKQMMPEIFILFIMEFQWPSLQIKWKFLHIKWEKLNVNHVLM